MNSHNTTSSQTTSTCRSCGHSIPADLGEVCEICLPVEEVTKIVWLSRHDLSPEQVGDLLRGKAGHVEKIDLTWSADDEQVHCELVRIGRLQREEGCLIAAVLPAQVWHRLYENVGCTSYPVISVPISEPATAPDGTQRGFKHSRWVTVGGGK